MLKRLDAAYSALLRAMLGIASLYLFLQMAAIVYITISRTAGWYYTPASFAFIEYGFIYIMMLGSPWLVRTRGHVFIEIVTGSVSPATRRWLSRTIAVLCTLACIFLAIFGADIAWTDFCGRTENGLCIREIDVRSIDIPRWIVTVSLPIGFALMAAEFARFVFGKELMHPDKIGTFG
ncbi:MAG: TRAP transporter small permease [Rhodospirillaceae bacterium]|nr:TRAP transporter small permease [Rhodospirillaceae bacterium]